MRKQLLILFLLLTATASWAQIQRRTIGDSNDGTQSGFGNGATNNRIGTPGDSASNKEVPIGIKVWTIDERFGDRTDAQLDTMPHMYPNTIFTTGLRGEYNTTGNLGAPRLNRIFADRTDEEDFIFTRPYDFFIYRPSTFHFTNTLSPFTNISYNTAGNRTNGEDHFTAKFGVNAGKKIGVGFLFNYIYGRGYYSEQATSHFNYTGYASYLGDRYQAHLLFSTNHQKVTENGGITNDRYITHPESFDDNYSASELPTVLEQNWNRNDNQHLLFTHRYNVGFNRKVKMTEEEIKARKFAQESKKENDARKERERQAKANGLDPDDLEDEQEQKSKETFGGRPDGAKVAGYEPADTTHAGDRVKVAAGAQADSLKALEDKAKEDTTWLKNEYVPVTSFIHTLQLDNYRRIYQAYQTPDGYYANTFKMDEKFAADSIFDQTKHYRLRNTFAISMLEGFNKWAKAGLKGFITHELRHFTLPDSVGTQSYNESSIYVGGQLSKTQGKALHFNVTGQFGIVGEDAGELQIDGHVDLNIPLFGDTLQIAGNGFFHRRHAAFYYNHYHARHFRWDNDLDDWTHSRLEGILTYPKTGTTLRVAVDELTNYTYFGMSYSLDSTSNDLKRSAMNVTPLQSGDAITLITAQLAQNFMVGPLGWETVVTWQKSTKVDILPVPSLNIYTNLFLKFKIAHVLRCELGADVRYFTKYKAPEYSPALGYYAVQQNEQKVEVGNYPIVNAYLNFHLKHTRFFVMFSHVNAGSGNKNYFLAPHYPLNERILRFGVSWNFFN